MYVGPYESYEVSDSGRKVLDGTPYKETFAIIEPYDCVPGRYYTAVTTHYIPPPNVVMSPATLLRTAR